MGKTDVQKSGAGAYPIDVIIPVYNCASYIGAAIDSVLDQTLRPQRIIVVDDGSSDGTPAILHDYVTRMPSVIDYVRKQNGGLSSARNAGLARATSEFVAFLDADDVWLKEKLERQVAVFHNSEFVNLGVVYCSYGIIDSRSVEIPGAFILKPKKKMRGDVFRRLLTMNQISSSGSGVLVRRECFDVVGEFDEELSAAEDWDMWLRIAEKYAFDYCDERLVMLRRHANNMQNNRLHMFTNEAGFYRKWADRLPPGVKVPLRWPNSLARSVIQFFPDTERLGVIEKTFTRPIRRRVFRLTHGSVGLYLVVITLYLGFLESAGVIKRLVIRLYCAMRIHTVSKA